MTIKDLPFPPIESAKKSYILREPLTLGHINCLWSVPSGVKVLIFQTNNFGYCVLPKGCLTTAGIPVPNRIHRY